MVGDMCQSTQVQLRGGLDVFGRCPDMFRSYRENTGRRGDEVERHPGDDRAGEPSVMTSLHIYVDSPDQNDTCPGKQRTVRPETQTVRGKTPLATAAAQESRGDAA
jgi:hypothetical protein